MKKTFINISFFITITFLFSSCSAEFATREKTVFFFDTVITAKVYGNDGNVLDETLGKCFDELKEIEDVFSVSNSESELSKLNEAAYNNPVHVSDELFFVIKTALYYCELSDGALDISLGRLTDLWGIGTENEKIPSADDISQFVGVSYKNVIIDESKKTVSFSDKRVKIDLGAVAKGYAGDRILQILSESNVTGAVFSLGGNIVTFGTKPDGFEFVIGIADPKNNDNEVATVITGTEAVVTSGDYQRYFIENGKIYHHILNSETGFPAESGLSGVTIICENSMEADCLSTAVFVLGKDKGLELIESIENAEALLIDNDGEISASSGIGKYNLGELK